MRDDCVRFVDEEEPVQRPYRQEFEKSGLNVLTALSGELGFRVQAGEEAVTVIFAYQMSGTSGVTFAAEVRSPWPDAFCFMVPGRRGFGDGRFRELRQRYSSFLD